MNGSLSFSVILVLLLGFGIGTQIRKLKLAEPVFVSALLSLVLYVVLSMLNSQITGIPLQELLYHPVSTLMFMALVFVLGLGTRGQIERLRQRR
jgi:archaellum biogenesis protein FlaJ (TadC family)